MESIFAEKPQADEKLLRISSKTDQFECYAAPHGRQIAAISDALAAAFNLASRDRLILQQASLIHDVGEAAMNRDYIRTSFGLTAGERIDLQRHPVIGEQEAAKLGLSRGVQLVVRWHHEWWNGCGYPDGIENEQIPVAARILRLADTYSSLTSARPFRAAMPVDVARKYLAEWAGIEFDPSVVKAFLSLKPAEETLSPTIAPEPVDGELSIA